MPEKTGKRGIVFAGAGASAAVDRDNFPTTADFFKRLPETISDDSIFKLVEGFLRKGDTDAIIDIEDILWNLQSLRGFLNSTSSGADIVGYAIAKERLLKTINPGWNFGHLSQAKPSLISSIDAIISAINSQVYDLYGETPSIEKLRPNWISLLDLMSKLEHSFDIFTTNYDINIETAVEHLFPADCDAHFGTKGTRHRILDMELWRAAQETDAGLLTKLHGSLDWKTKDNKIYVGDPLFTGDHSKQGIIYPGFKGVSDNLFFKPFHDYFERRLSRASLVVFIGFAFRDEYITESIRNNLDPSAKVIIINPAKSVKFPYNRSVAKYIHKGFNESIEPLKELLKL